MSRRTAERLGLVALLIVLAAVLASATLVDRVPPSVARIFLTRTSGGDTVAMTHAAIGVQFSEPVRHDGAQLRFHLDPAVAGAFSWADDRTLLFTPAQKLPNTAQFTVVEGAGFEDEAGNAASKPSSRFTFVTVGQPTVTATSPAAGAADVALDSSLVVTFDRLMDTERTAAAVTLDPSTALQASWRGATLTLRPDGAFLPDTTYTLSIGTGAADTDGNQLASVDRIAFHTLQVGLAIRSVLPADGAAGVALEAPIGILFGAAVDPTSIAGSLTITPALAGSVSVAVVPDDPVPSSTPGAPGGGPSPSLTPGSGGPTTGSSPSGPAGSSGTRALPSTGGSPAASGAVVSAEPTLSASPTPSASPSQSGNPSGGSLVLFQPSQPLAPSTTYVVVLRAGVVKGLDPAVAARGLTWSFTTGPPAESLQNQILFLSARGGSENVWAMNPDGTGAHQVTAETAPVTAYDVTLDGRFLAYSVAGMVKVVTLASGQVTIVTDPSVAEYAPRLLPDGSAVIVGRRDRGSGADEGWWLLPLSGGSGGARQLLPDGAPPLGSAVGAVEMPAGPLGPWTAIEAIQLDGHLALVPRADGSLALVVLSTGEGETAAPGTVIGLALDQAAGPAAWSSVEGGFLIVAHDAVSGALGTWLIRPDGSIGAGPALAAWSTTGADGSIAGLSSTAPGHLAVAAGLDALPSILTTASDLQDREPAFGPGGSALVFVRVPTAAPATSAGIWTVDRDGRELLQLSTDGSEPRWLP